ncbi:hypothetical protein PHYBLDRAFT_58979 [Phycomyces blakesleeanus NRRL 1555(-)]|uniref:Uncharacterized protein n=1 Tax=Phycomyces blakesleeanus (strain ATCC 8743b / DSM 1359 / FGSC 10004 / NBRC 33097 / NRRL 1555) TaxID=763407 RepID=A0A162Q4B4_PHYB8|nr:hypothetical protein PHYBLDRAFT_58979 [Phycomyces blakesleeanus NRRL 1555(-)]OAD79936.1 hypothetical protein PHYBLDRAFT_58979 [Phycomyces blakesleeanus NRRL 1555(-)]|eukprot:XP_018297976.1 hypothetical protein PHYBLDRAFT_58979 [Phycomyces blakesleeanus NRRL 1555(-)]
MLLNIQNIFMLYAIQTVNIKGKTGKKEKTGYTQELRMKCIHLIGRSLQKIYRKHVRRIETYCTKITHNIFYLQIHKRFCVSVSEYEYEYQVLKVTILFFLRKEETIRSHLAPTGRITQVHHITAQ